MGILTDPNNDDKNNKIAVVLKKYGGKLGFLSYISGIVWLAFLANHQYNLGTYFSENALLPGLVVENFHDGYKAESFLNELLEKEASYGRLSSHDFKEFFERIGLSEIELQNFTLKDPVTKHDDIHGTNVFAVFRAKRAAGTESIIFNAPYFPKNGKNRRNLAAIAIMLALAEYFQEQVYWAKDIVFLVAESHVGSLAWVKAHQEMSGTKGNLDYDNIISKAGNIQAAVNVVMEGNTICSLATKFHGVNGQLPNLDLVNLLNKFFVTNAEKVSDWETDIWKLVNYMITQATGTPTGSHGFFLKYGIESVSLVGKTAKTCKPRHSITFSDIGRTLEATFRSLNNLLERLHQSFFFYLKTTPNRFISIGLYFPPLGLILLPILLKGAAIWITTSNLEITKALFTLMFTHSVSVGLRWILTDINRFASYLGGFTVDENVFYHIVLAFTSLQFIVTKVITKNGDPNYIAAVYCFSLLEFATVLYSLALFNPSLVIFSGIVLVPILTLLFKFEAHQRSILYGIGTALLVALASYFYSALQFPVGKYFYEAELYGNFLFDFAFLFVVPIVSLIMSVV